MFASDIAARPALRPSIAGGIVALAAAMGIGRFAYTPLLPAMQHAVGFDTAQAGLLASANYAGYLAGALLVPLVPAAARAGALRLALVATAATTALMAATAHLTAWAAIRFVSGLASAGVFVLASTLVLGVLRRAGRSSLAGWLYSGPGIGIALAGLAVRGASGRVDWRGQWLLLALLAAAAIAPSRRWLTDQAVAPPARPTAPREAGAVPRAALGVLGTAYFLEGVGYIVSGTFLVAIVDRTPGLPVSGADVWIVVGLAGAPSSVLWGMVAARLGYARALAFAYVALACGIVLPLVGTAPAVLLAAILFGGTFLGIAALTLTFAGRLAPESSAGVIGVLTAAFGVGQVAGPALGGIVAARAGGFTPVLIAAAALVAVGAALVATLRAFDESGPMAGGSDADGPFARGHGRGTGRDRTPGRECARFAACAAWHRRVARTANEAARLRAARRYFRRTIYHPPAGPRGRAGRGVCTRADRRT